MEEELHQKLERLREQGLPLVNYFEKGLELSRTSIQQLRHLIINHTFAGVLEEISVLKEGVPRLYSHFVFHLKLYRFFHRFPKSGDGLQKRFLQKEIKIIQSFFKRHIDFISYYRSGKTFSDAEYFLRNQQNTLLMHEYSSALGDQFCTIHSCLAARMIAYEKVLPFLEQELYQLEHKEDVPADRKWELHWAGTKTDLAELLYLLDTLAVVHGPKGPVSLNLLIKVAEDLFQIKLGEVPRLFAQMRIRENRVAFTDKGRERLLRRMDETDDRRYQ